MCRAFAKHDMPSRKAAGDRTFVQRRTVTPSNESSVPPKHIWASCYVNAPVANYEVARLRITFVARKCRGEISY